MKGFSVIEVVLAAAIFMLFSTAAVTLILGGFNTNRLGAEETIANQFASEGIEAVKSIKNQAYSNLITPNPTPRAVVTPGGVWAFGAAGSSNTLLHNSTDNYIRQVKVESVNRDGSGNIVPAPTGTLDSDTKKITSTVSWKFNSARPESVILSTYLSDWRKAIPRGGTIVYGDASTTPKTRSYDSATNIFSAQSSTVLGASGLSFQIKTSPTKLEAIAGYVTTEAANNLHIMCYNGTDWTNEWTATVGGTGSTRRFDIAYETSSGDVIVIYSRGVVATNGLAYNTKQGTLGCGTTNWLGAINFPTTPSTTTGTVNWVKMASDRKTNSNIISVIWADSNAALGATNWNGSSLVTGVGTFKVLETSLEIVTTAQDVDDFDVEFESVSGDVMVVWANSAGKNNTNGVRYSTCTGGIATCTWLVATTPPTFSDDATNLDISANPNTDEIVFASIGNDASDLQLGYWSGNAWTNNFANVDVSAQTPLAGTHLVTTGWLIFPPTTRAVVVYGNATNPTLVNARYLSTPSTWTPVSGTEPSVGTQTLFTPAPLFATQKWYDIQMDPFNKEQLMFALSDVSGTNNRLFAKRLIMTAAPVFTWSNSDDSDGAGPGTGPLQANLGQATTAPFGFTYWRNP